MRSRLLTAEQAFSKTTIPLAASDKGLRDMTYLMIQAAGDDRALLEDLSDHIESYVGSQFGTLPEDVPEVLNLCENNLEDQGKQ